MSSDAAPAASFSPLFGKTLRHQLLTYPASAYTTIWCKKRAKAHRQWTDLFASYSVKYPDLAKEINQMQRRELPIGWDRNLPVFATDQKGIAGREASGKVLNALAQNIPWFLGGSADLGPSNKTTLKYDGAGDFQADNPKIVENKIGLEVAETSGEAVTH